MDFFEIELTCQRQAVELALQNVVSLAAKSLTGRSTTLSQGLTDRGLS
jgi:hypothetical protein